MAFARGGSGKRQSAAASVFSFQSGSETRSLYQEVMDTDIMGILGEGEAEEVFRVLKGWRCMAGGRRAFRSSSFILDALRYTRGA